MWYPISGRPAPTFPKLTWTPACELRLQHRRFDAPASHPSSPGIFVDRHVAPGRTLPLPRITREHPGADEDPAGASLSLASAPGGALYQAEDGRSRFQRDWDFLAFHAKTAIERRQLLRPIPNHEQYLQDTEPTAWQVAEALATYAASWKTRIPQLGPSVHPVDVLLHSYHCAGAANVCFALAMVLGIPARRISTSGHSTCELLIDGRWCWIDNIRDAAYILPMSYQDFLAGLPHWPSCSESQRAHHCKGEVFYRAPYDYSAALSWRLGGDLPAASGEGDVHGGIGLSVHYDPATAEALYPGHAPHRFHADACAAPTITVGAKGGWLHAPIELTRGQTLRRRFFVSECADNPIELAELRVWCAPEADPDLLRARWNGVELPPAERVAQRGVHHALRVSLPTGQLTPGWHELSLQVASANARLPLLCFPDPVEEAEAGVIDHPGITIDPAQIATDPVVDPAPVHADVVAPSLSGAPH